MHDKDRAELQQVVEMVVNPIASALNRIADALEQQAEATALLARATAGEFDNHSEEGSEPLPTSLSQVPRGNGMGMG